MLIRMSLSSKLSSPKHTFTLQNQRSGPLLSRWYDAFFISVYVMERSAPNNHPVSLSLSNTHTQTKTDVRPCDRHAVLSVHGTVCSAACRMNNNVFRPLSRWPHWVIYCSSSVTLKCTHLKHPAYNCHWFGETSKKKCWANHSKALVSCLSRFALRLTIKVRSVTEASSTNVWCKHFLHVSLGVEENYR